MQFQGEITFIYVPTEHEEMKYQKTKRELISNIVELLPKISLPLSGTSDYPSLSINALENFGVDYHKRRPVFVIGGIAFFLRYQNEWSGTLMWGKKTNETKVTWQSDVTMDLLEKIRDSVHINPNISHEEMSSLFLQCGKKC